MMVWNVKPVFDNTNKIKYTVLSYNLIEVAKAYLKHPTIYNIKFLLDFCKNCRLSEKSAKKYADYKSKKHDIEW